MFQIILFFKKICESKWNFREFLLQCHKKLIFKPIKFKVYKLKQDYLSVERTA